MVCKQRLKRVLQYTSPKLFFLQKIQLRDKETAFFWDLSDKSTNEKPQNFGQQIAHLSSSCKVGSFGNVLRRNSTYYNGRAYPVVH